MSEFPPNSHKSKSSPPPEQKEVKRVVTGEAVRRKPSLGKKFKNAFFGGDGRTATQFLVTEVVVPSIRNTLHEGITRWTEQVIFGGSHHRSHSSRGPTGTATYTPYNRFSMGQKHDDRPPMPNQMSRRGRARHDFDEIVLETRADATEVLDSLYEILSQFEVVSVADLYGLVGFKSDHIDQRWGWTELHGSGVVRTRDGFVVDLPRPEPLA